MKRILEILVTLYFVFFPLGQLLQISTGWTNISFYLVDLVVGLTVMVWIFGLKGKIFTFLGKLPFVKFGGIFLIVALISLIIASFNLSAGQVLASSLYLVRLFSYWGFFVVVCWLVATGGDLQRVRILLVISGVFVVIFGFLQYFFFPDFYFFTYYGWDPHYYRVLSTFLDPNFVGGFYTLFITLLVVLNISTNSVSKKNIYRLLTIVTFFALVYTFSRSSYLAFLVSMAVISIFRSKRVFLYTVVGLYLATTFIPRSAQRVSGALAVDVTAKARIYSWIRAVEIGSSSPIIGVGFNTYRYVQEKAGYFPKGYEGGHSGAGVDSSLLLVFATTGTLGLTAFAFLLGDVFKYSFLKAKNSIWGVCFLASFLGLLAHSQFVNSFFYPWIMGWFVVVGAVFVGREISEKK